MIELNLKEGCICILWTDIYVRGNILTWIFLEKLFHLCYFSKKVNQWKKAWYRTTWERIAVLYWIVNFFWCSFYLIRRMFYHWNNYKKWISLKEIYACLFKFFLLLFLQIEKCFARTWHVFGCILNHKIIF